MKIETKRKILWWVKRVLCYAEYMDNKPHTVVEPKKIVKVRSEYTYPLKEILRIDDHQLNYASNMQLMSELEKRKLIKYSQHLNKETKIVRIVAQLDVLVP